MEEEGRRRERRFISVGFCCCQFPQWKHGELWENLVGGLVSDDEWGANDRNSWFFKHTTLLLTSVDEHIMYVWMCRKKTTTGIDFHFYWRKLTHRSQSFKRIEISNHFLLYEWSMCVAIYWSAYDASRFVEMRSNCILPPTQEILLFILFSFYLAFSGNDAMFFFWSLSTMAASVNSVTFRCGYCVVYILHHFHPQLRFQLPSCGRNTFQIRKGRKKAAWPLRCRVDTASINSWENSCGNRNLKNVTGEKNTPDLKVQKKKRLSL